MTYSNKQLRIKFKRAKARHQHWVAQLWEVYQYVLPFREGFNQLFEFFEDSGKFNQNEIYDPTAEMASVKRAVELRALLLPPYKRWGSIKTNDNGSVDGRVLDSINDAIFNALNTSNLSQQSATSALDLSIGTAGLWIEYLNEERPLNFVSISSAQLIPEYHSSGQVEDAWFIEAKTKAEILENYPAAKRIDFKDTSKNEDSICYVVVGNIWEADEGKWRHVEFLSDHWEQPLTDTLRDYKQLIVFRDFVRPGEVHGRGLGMILLPQIKSLNRMVMQSLSAFEKRANPPLFKDPRFLINPNQINSWSGMIFSRPVGVQEPLMPLQMPEYPSVFEEIESMRQLIKDSFAVEPLGPVNLPPKTATEIAARQDEAQRFSQTDISRLVYELSSKVFMSSLMILGHAGLLPISYKQLRQEIKNKRVDFHYVSPLEQIQQSSDLSELVQGFEVIQQYYGEQAILAATDPVEVRQYLARCLNLPSKLFKSKQQLQQLFGKLMEQQAAQAPGQPPLPQPSTAAQPIPAAMPQGTQL